MNLPHRLTRSWGKSMQLKTIGIIGYGNFGAFLAEMVARFLPGVAVRVYSRRCESDGDKFFDIETACASDAVIICGSIAEFEKQLLEVLKYAPQETVIVDVATVKKHTVQLLQKHAASRPWIATHPMFGPESVKKQKGSVEGLTCVVAERTLSKDAYMAIRALLESFKLNVVEMGADEHDRLLAETLFLTHYIGQTMKVAGFERTPIDTLSFSFLMSAVESVSHDDRLFKDVYHFNPYCSDAASRFHDAQEQVFRGLEP